MAFSLFFILPFVTISTQLVVSKFVTILGCSNHSQIIFELLFLQVSLGQILELTFAKTQLGRTGHCQLGAIPRNDDIVGCQLSRLATNLDAILQVFFKTGHVQDLIVYRSCAVDDKFSSGFLSLDLFTSKWLVAEKKKREAGKDVSWGTKNDKKK